MDILPNDIENIILSYKENIEITEKFKKTLILIKYMNIEYHISLGHSFNLQYIIKVMNYDNKEKVTIICKCCGNNIFDTHDHYYNYFLNDNEILNFLFYMEYSLKRNYKNKRTLRCNKYS